VGDYNILF